ncbi:MAG TPA: Gfo/Idh/MocA family oxidoreductase, partial [Polyangia bacterium]|nr:Gfo/Idh/MocA family oxidoreductase [Polyangia bacterium]
PRFGRRRLLFSAAALAAAPPVAPDPPVRLLRKVRLALLGFQGGHASEVLTPLPRLPEVEVVALAEPDEKERARFAARPELAKARAYADWRQMLEKEKVDLVAINNQNGERARTILACVARGLDVYAEKPLAVSRAELAAVKKAVAAKKIALGMQLPMRFSPAYLALKKIVDQGLIGEVAQMGAQKSYKIGTSRGELRAPWFFHRASYGGTIPWIGIHMIDLMRFTSGRELRQVAGFQSHVGFPELGDMENVTASLFKLDNGGVATLRMDYLRPSKAPTHGDDRLRLAGTKGIAEYQESTGVTLVTSEAAPAKLDLPPKGTSAFVDFLLASYEGKAPALPLADIYRANEIALAAFEAAAQGRTLAV